MNHFCCPELLGNMQGIILVKDCNSVVKAVTNELALIAGFKSFEEAIGVTDYDVPCKVSEYAEFFRKYDRIAMQAKHKILSIDNQPYVGGWKTLIVERNAILDKNGIVEGVCSSCVDVTGTNLSRLMINYTIKDSKVLGNTDQPYSYLVTTEHNRKNLTLRQQECLFFLLRGYNYMEIGHVLHISPRTVEDHIQNLYLAFDCSKKSELIEKALDAGYLMHIPRTLV